MSDQTEEKSEKKKSRHKLASGVDKDPDSRPLIYVLNNCYASDDEIDGR